MAEKKEASTPKVSAAKKTTPNLRDEASEETFKKDYLAYVDDTSTVPDEIHDRNKKDVEQSALQRGLRATGEAKLDSKKVVDDNNVYLTYSLPVEPNNFRESV